MIRRQFFSYVGIGALSALIDIGTMQGLLLLGSTAELGVTLGFAVGLAFNYVCQGRVTFKVTSTSLYTVFKFGVFTLLNYALTMICVWISLWWLDSVLIGKLVSLPLVAVNGFLGSRYWIFAQPGK